MGGPGGASPFLAVYRLPGEHRKLPQRVMAEPIKLLLFNLFEKKSELSGSILEGFLIMNKDVNHGLNKNLYYFVVHADINAF